MMRLISKFTTSKPGKLRIAIHTAYLVQYFKKAIRQWNLVSYWNITWKFFLKNNTQNVLENLFPDPILKDQNGVYLWINNLKIYAVCFDCMLSWGLSKYIETKLQTTCFYLVKKLSFIFKKKGFRTLVSLTHYFLYEV